MENPELYSASSMALSSANIKEIYSGIFYTNNYGDCDAQTIRFANIKLVIIIDQRLFIKREFLKKYVLELSNLYHKRIPGVNDCNHPYRYGTDVETIDITFGGPNETIEQLLQTCKKVVRVLSNSNISGQRSIIIDYNDDDQRGYVIATAYAIFHKTQTYYEALVELFKSHNIKVYIDDYYSSLLFEFESLVTFKKSNKKYEKKDDPALNDTWNPNICDRKAYLAYVQNDNKEKLRMIQHLNDGKPMEDFVFVTDMEKEDDAYLTEDKYLSSGAGKWNDASFNSYDIFYEYEHKFIYNYE